MFKTKETAGMHAHDLPQPPDSELWWRKHASCRAMPKGRKARKKYNFYARRVRTMSRGPGAQLITCSVVI